MKTTEEIDAALEDGDHYCKCGHRKSLHDDGTHPAIDPHTGKCNAGGFKYSYMFNEAVPDESWVRDQKALKRQEAKARKTMRGAA